MRKTKAERNKADSATSSHCQEYWRLNTGRFFYHQLPAILSMLVKFLLLHFPHHCIDLHRRGTRLQHPLRLLSTVHSAASDHHPFRHLHPHQFAHNM